MVSIVDYVALHSDFTRRFVTRFRNKLDGRGLSEWIEWRANSLATLGQVSNKIHFTDNYLRALGVSVSRLSGSIANNRNKAPSWTADISLAHEHSEIEMRILRNEADQRAVLAHELAHAVIASNPLLEAMQSARRLYQDPGIERLADDIARALLLPSSLLSEISRKSPSEAAYWQKTSILEHLRNACVPVRVGLTRVIANTMREPCAILCIAASNKSDLYLKQEKNGVLANEKWMVYITPCLNSVGAVEYTLSDHVRLSAKISLQGPEFDGTTMRSGSIDEIVPSLSKVTKKRLRSFASCTVIASAQSDSAVSVYLLFTIGEQRPR